MQKADSMPGFPVILLLVIGAGVLLVARQPQTVLAPAGTNQPLAVRGDAPPPEIAGVREIHWVTSPDRCQSMDRQFKQQGRRVTFVRAIPNPFGSGGFQLRFGCIFEGDDAVPGYYTGDKRYEGTGRANEWQAP